MTSARVRWGRTHLQDPKFWLSNVTLLTVLLIHIENLRCMSKLLCLVGYFMYSCEQYLGWKWQFISPVILKVAGTRGKRVGRDAALVEVTFRG
jgi:hypothetical protein